MRFQDKSILMTRSFFFFFFFKLGPPAEFESISTQLGSSEVWREMKSTQLIVFTLPSKHCWNKQHDAWGWWGKEGGINASRTAYPPLVLPFLLRWVRGSLEANFSSSFHSFSHSSSVYTSPDYTHTHRNPDKHALILTHTVFIIVHFHYFYLHPQGF